MAGDARFHVAITGQAGGGRDPAAVREAFSLRTGLDPARVAELFERAPVVIRKDLAHAEALAYKDMVEQETGALCDVVPVALAGPEPAGGGDAPPAPDLPESAGPIAPDPLPGSGEPTRPGPDAPLASGSPVPARVGAGRGWIWIAAGFSSLRRGPVAWLGILIVGLLATLGSLLIPIVNVVAPNLLPIVLLGGLMMGCHSQSQGGRLRVGHLFAGFAEPLLRLLGVGAASLGLSLLVAGVLVAVFVFGLDGVALVNRIRESETDALGPVLFEQAKAAGVLALVAAVLYLPLMMALWFAPALIAVGRSGILASLKASLVGCLRNWLPFLVYGLVWTVITAIPVAAAVLHPLAGVAAGVVILPVMIPVAVGSIYAAYRDIYSDAIP